MISAQEFALNAGKCGAMTHKQLQNFITIADFELRIFELAVRNTGSVCVASQSTFACLVSET